MPDIQQRITIPLALGVSATGPSISWPGGPGVVSAEATWGGGTVTLQTQTPLGTWVAVGVDTTFTANAVAGFILPKGASLRALIATATAVFVYVTTLS